MLSWMDALPHIISGGDLTPHPGSGSSLVETNTPKANIASRVEPESKYVMRANGGFIRKMWLVKVRNFDISWINLVVPPMS